MKQLRADVRGDETTLIAGLRDRGEAVVWCPGLRVRHYVLPARMSRPDLEELAKVSALAFSS
jgi:hypothetical protein